jgi:hypothetical protein
MPSSNPYEVRLVTCAFVEDRSEEITDLLGAAFSDSSFLDSSTSPERPARDTWKEIHERGRSKLGHVIALSGDGKILGGLFCLPLDGSGNEIHCDVGWFFTARSVAGAQGEEIGDAIMRRAHEELAKAGYEAVVTRMGTEEIARYMSERHRYLPAPIGDERDRWIKSLREGPASRSSVKKRWKNEGGQGARYATTDIAKDEIILDLTMLFERASGPSAMTVQLADGGHYRSSEGPFGLNHHCSPNGYIRFEDLTYRALRDISEGDELTFHYCTTELEMASPFDCLCGSADCLGRVGGLTYMDESEIEKIRPFLSPFLESKL